MDKNYLKFILSFFIGIIVFLIINWKNGFSISAMSRSSAFSFFNFNGQNLNENSSKDDIKAAYRTLALTMHPDKGGNTSDFQTLILAYETLLNPLTTDHVVIDPVTGREIEFHRNYKRNKIYIILYGGYIRFTITNPGNTPNNGIIRLGTFTQLVLTQNRFIELIDLPHEILWINTLPNE